VDEERETGGRGFVMVDLAAVMVVAAVVIALLVLASSNQRRLARLGDDVAHLKEIGAGSGQYVSDNADQFWTYTWRHGVTYQTTYPDLNNTPDDLWAAANQAVYLLRTRGGRTDPLFPVIGGAWIPHISFNFLILADYLDKKLPWTSIISSEDRERQKWANDPACFDRGCFLPCQPDPSTPANLRYPYGGSYLTPTCFYDQSPVGSRLYQSGAYNLYYYISSGTVLAPAHLSDVAYPSQKVIAHDQNARHFGARKPYCTHDEARLPLLMVDGSVPIRNAGESNPGWDPNNPNNTGAHTTLSYSSPQCWEPPSLNPAGDVVIGRFRYTRRGVLGRDFGGPEVN
jgi:hypothetical protein